MSEPIVVIATFRPLPGEHDLVRDAIAEAVADVHKEPGCELYAAHSAEDGSFIMVEKWSSAGYLDSHGDGAPLATLRRAVRHRLRNDIEIVRASPILLGEAAKGAL